MLTIILILVAVVAVTVALAKFSPLTKAIPPDPTVPTSADTTAMVAALENPSGEPVQVPAEKVPQ